MTEKVFIASKIKDAANYLPRFLPQLENLRHPQQPNSVYVWQKQR